MLQKAELIDTSKNNIDCELIERILADSLISQILMLEEKKESICIMRLFSLREEFQITCEGFVHNWDYLSFDKMRPSKNTGYNRDILFDFNQYHLKNEISVYLATHEKRNNISKTIQLKYVLVNEQLERTEINHYLDHHFAKGRYQRKGLLKN